MELIDVLVFPYHSCHCPPHRTLITIPLTFVLCSIIVAVNKLTSFRCKIRFDRKMLVVS